MFRQRGPVLVLCLHRNGAVDGFVYRGALPAITFMVKASLRRSVFGRMFFDGIEVMRGTAGSRADRNLEALDDCVALLGDGGWLVVFPEGTSKLGPRHLPFKSGAARIAQRHLEGGRALTVLPLGIHYECPWAFRSRVEVVVGPPLHLAPGTGGVDRGARLQELKRRFAEIARTGGCQRGGRRVAGPGPEVRLHRDAGNRSRLLRRPEGDGAAPATRGGHRVESPRGEGAGKVAAAPPGRAAVSAVAPVGVCGC